MQSARFFLALIMIAAGSAHAAEQLTIAVASNFQTTAKEIAARFSATTDIAVRISSGSTGSLYARIVNGAPYDIFLAADTARPQLLEEGGFAIENSSFVYASGRLVLWSADPRFRDRDCSEDLASGAFTHLAIANPRTAPYGLAAKSFLQSQQLWDSVSDRLVVGENIAQTFQFVATGNATLGLIAASQIIDNASVETTCIVMISEQTAGDVQIHQAAVVLSASQNKSAAKRFMRFMQTSDVAALLVQHGYRASADSAARF